MGCDIHCKVFLYNKNKKEYLDINGYYDSDWNFVFTNPLGEMIFNKISTIEERYYDFFGIMGNNSRSNRYSQMKCLKDCYPDYLKEFLKKDIECADFYGFCHCQLNRLLKGFSSYKNRLEKLKRDKTIHDFMIRHLEVLIDELKDIENLKDDPEFNIICGINGYNIDISKTMFVFFFDN